MLSYFSILQSAGIEFSNQPETIVSNLCTGRPGVLIVNTSAQITFLRGYLAECSEGPLNKMASWWSWTDPWAKKENDPWAQNSSSSQPTPMEIEDPSVKPVEKEDEKMEPIVLKSAEEVTDEKKKRKQMYCGKSSSTVVAECGSDTAEVEGKEVWEDVVMKEEPPRVDDPKKPKYSKTEEEWEIKCQVCHLTLRGRSQYTDHFRWGNTSIA